MNVDELDDIQNATDSDGVGGDARCELCPEQELERLECEQPQKMIREQVGDSHEILVSRILNMKSLKTLGSTNFLFKALITRSEVFEC